MTRRQRVVARAAAHWPAVSRVLPRRHLPWPTRAGTVYLSLANSPTQLQRVLRTYEPDKFANIARFLPPGGVFVDVGANMGDFTLWAVRCGGPGTRVLAVEAEPENATWLRRTVARHGLDGQVQVQAVAASTQTGTVDLLRTATSGTHSIVENELHALDAFRPRDRVTVPTRRLDDLVAEAGLARVDVVKIDVEGAEQLVLDGATGLLGSAEPLVLLIDLHFGVDVAALARQLQDRGFTLRREPAPDEVVPEVPPGTLSIVAVRTARAA